MELAGIEFRFRFYTRSFRSPLNTHHGLWTHRQGIVIRLTTPTGEHSYGEIAPIPWFGSETLQQALEYCKSLPDRIGSEQIDLIPTDLPATQFGFETAWQDLIDPPRSAQDSRPIPLCGLLPAGEMALEDWRVLWQQGYCSFKWKIGVGGIDWEQGLLRELQQDLPATARLRLDANGGLSLEEARLWLGILDPQIIEFIEQPLSPESWSDLLELGRVGFPIPIALDESITTVERLEWCHRQGWRGIYVIKPGIMGSPRRLRRLLETIPLDLVFSSVFETQIGAYHSAQLIRSLDPPQRAAGFGVRHFLQSDSSTGDPFQDPPNLVRADFDTFWDQL